MFSSLIKGSSLLYDKFFSPESIPQSDNLTSILNFYTEQEALEIITQVLSNFPLQYSIISEDSMTWMLQILGFSLRYLDYENATIKQSISTYIQWIEKFPLKDTKEEENDKYIEIFIFHLSQAFSSLSFYTSVQIIVKNLNYYIFEKRDGKNSRLISLYVCFLIGGACELLHQIESIETQKHERTEVSKFLFNAALSAITKGKTLDLDIKQVDSMLDILLKNQIYAELFVMKFSEYYKSRLDDYSHHEDDIFLKFYIERINKKLNAENKYKAFSQVIQRWMGATIETTEHNKLKELCIHTWPTKIIQKLFLQWFSIDCAMEDITPLFNLLHYGEKKGTEVLNVLAEHIIVRCLTEPTEKLHLSFLKIVGYYLIGHMKFAATIADKIADYLDEYQKSKKYDAEEESWIIVVINNLFAAGALEGERKKKTIENLFILDLKNTETLITSLIHIAILFTYAFINESVCFWSWLSTLKQLNNGDTFEDIELYASFISLVMNDPNFSEKFVFERDKINKELTSDNEIKRLKLLLSLLVISFGTKHFSTNGKDTCDILKIFENKNAKDAEKVFYSVLRTSILCGGDYITTYNGEPGEEVEHYVTRNYIISIVGRHKLVVRHPLGVTTFNIEETGEKSLQFEEYLPPIVSDCEDDEDEEDQIDDSELDNFGKEIMKMNSFFHDESDFVPYKIQPDPVTESDVYSMLVDMGFMNYGSQEFVKRVPESMNGIVDEFDKIDPKSDLSCGVLQFREGSKEFISEKNDKLMKLMHDLSSDGNADGVFDTQLISLTYTAPCLDQNDASNNTPLQRVRGMGFVIALNEDMAIIDRSHNDVKSIDFLLVLTQLGKYYDIELVNTKVGILTPFIANNNHWTVKEDNLGKFISIIALMFFTFPNVQKQRGPFSYIIKCDSRIAQIKNLFSNVKEQPGLSSFARLRTETE